MEGSCLVRRPRKGSPCLIVPPNLYGAPRLTIPVHTVVDGLGPWDPETLGAFVWVLNSTGGDPLRTPDDLHFVLSSLPVPACLRNLSGTPVVYLFCQPPDSAPVPLVVPPTNV